MLIPNDSLLKKNILTAEEISARRGKLFIIYEETIDPSFFPKESFLLAIPAVHTLFNPVFFVIPLQILAMKIANILGYNVDKPRNLAKSVTVE
jgi:glucosamine--fructose-6-phosphate aminotransferase (isomerizing)